MGKGPGAGRAFGTAGPRAGPRAGKRTCVGRTRGPGRPVVVCWADTVRLSSTKVLITDPTRRACPPPPGSGDAGEGEATAEGKAPSEAEADIDLASLTARVEHAPPVSATTIERTTVPCRFTGLFLWADGS